jgi:hypothetical protein
MRLAEKGILAIYFEHLMQLEKGVISKACSLNKN